MAKPKNDQEPNEVPLTEQVSAPETVAVAEPVYYTPPAPRQMQIERQGSLSEPYVHHWPQVRGGICEWCGVLDRNVPSQFQYKLCPHYRGQQLRCSYCPENKDPDDIVYHAKLNIVSHPDRPGTLIVWCDSYDCSRAHENRFKRALA